MAKTIVGMATGLLLAGLGIAAPASAQCTDPDEVPDLVLAVVLELVGGRFLLPEKECDKIAKTAGAACHSAVASALKCSESLFKSVSKARKTACGVEEGDEQDDCEQSLEDFLTVVLAGIEAEAAAADLACDEGAADLAVDCFEP